MEKYGFKLGKDGRLLSDYQKTPWMREIGKRRKYLSMPKGEKHCGAKLNAGKVFIIRHPKIMTRKMANYYGRRYGISAGYVYHLRSPNPLVRKWKHLDRIKRGPGGYTT